jgi:aspyridone synthetase trans-acting enoyl reductase
MMLCKVSAVALNPADWKMVDFGNALESVGGSDFAGEITMVGENVTRFKMGDRVLGLAFGLNALDRTTGAFGEYVLAVEDLSCKIPDGMTYEEASTFGVSVGTVGYALYHALALPMPYQLVDSSFFVLVSGGSTATGTVAIQLLKA